MGLSVICFANDVATMNIADMVSVTIRANTIASRTAAAYRWLLLANRT